jgi:hypothetical protein
VILTSGLLALCFDTMMDIPSSRKYVCADHWQHRRFRRKYACRVRDAANYILALPKKESVAPEWQAAMEALILIAENGGPTMLARIGVMRGLNRHIERVFNQTRNATHWGERKLKRDQ